MLSARAVGVAETGGALTVIVTALVLVAPLPSVRLYVKLSVPMKAAFGVYVQPELMQVAVPLAGFVVFVTVLGPVPGVSLARTSTVTD